MLSKKKTGQQLSREFLQKTKERPYGTSWPVNQIEQEMDTTTETKLHVSSSSSMSQEHAQ
jgi:hypothetical protein